MGIRVPENKIARMIVQELGHPILSTTLPGDMVEEYTDPEIIEENFNKLVDIVINGGVGGVTPSTVVDCTGKDPVLIRKGLGEWVEEEPF